MDLAHDVVFSQGILNKFDVKLPGVASYLMILSFTRKKLKTSLYVKKLEIGGILME